MKDFFDFITFLLGIGTAIFGIFQYRNGQKVKKIELLENLIKEFENNGTYIARQLLDDFWFFTENHSKISRQNLEITLRDHRPDGINDQTEIQVRESFDKLFNFFSKLNYLLQLKLLKPSDLYYFEYYLKKIFRSDACLNYCELYGYSGILHLKKIKILSEFM